MDIDIRNLIGKLNPTCKRALEKAAEQCMGQTHYNVEVEHLLIVLLDEPAPDISLILDAFDLKADVLIGQLRLAVDRFKRGNGRTPALSPHIASLLQEAWMLSTVVLDSQTIRSGIIILSLLQNDSLRGMLIDSCPGLLQLPRESLRKQLPSLLANSAEGAVAARARAVPSSHSAGSPPQDSHKAGGADTPALDQFTTDLTALAREGRLDPIRGRENEIRQIIDILLRRRQNNPILTGEAGVGKTAVVEGFALRVAEGTVPPALLQVSVRTLDLGLLQAGAGIKGEFENRLKSVIAEVKASPTPIILFIDEAHQLIGAGGSEGAGDAANLLKPALARGELRTIAATTWAEYKKYVERDPALARRFQVVKVDEPTEDVAIEMLRGVVTTLAKHHNVQILDEAVRDTVRLSHRYITGRQLPDKAVSVLDTACARVAVGQNGKPADIEDLERQVQSIEAELRVLRHELATGTDHRARIHSQTDELGTLRERYKRLNDRIAEEKRAVEEIIALRRRIADEVDNAPTEGDEDADPQQHAAWLARLEKGLEAIQGDEPMVPVCVDSQVVASVISDWTGIPVGKMMTDELHTVLHLKEKLNERVVGQDQALDAIARRMQTYRASLDDPGKPVGVFLLVGPSGVGKTETAAALADTLYGGERNMIVVNMSEFQEPHTVSSLKGAPPGYVGYGHGGVLTEAVRRKPYSVVLLDELEKAHPDVLELFFQVFDKGVMDDGEGVQINFKNTVLLLTSNAAQDVITQACEHGRRPDPETLVQRLRPQLLRYFSPAFLGRLVIVPYYPLGDEQIRNIVRLKLAKIANRFTGNHAADFIFDEAVVDAITQRCTEVDSGARNIDHILTHAILPELAQQILERMAMAESFERVTLGIDEHGEFTFTFVARPLTGAA